MKKIYSLVAALLVAMVVMVSCASENTKNVSALLDAVKASDVATAKSLSEKLYAVKAQLTTDESCGLAAGYLGLVAIDEANKADYSQKVIEIVDAVNAKDAEGVKKFAAASKVDLVAAVDGIKAAQAAAQQAAEAAQQAAEAAQAAEGEAAEGEAAEGDAE
ncbi:MAG: hypothetical protein IIU11_00395 [Bacteroidales bacterium]|jgi:hypothetical protein|nr:hypothetical protein [Bacteroidales bacterium]MBR6277524.1 hypothetical protein [Bacteroidales bacterium]